MIASGRCHHHPARAGIGVCVLCRRTICAECTTQFDGINRCADCLQKMREQALPTRPVAPEWGPRNLLLTLLSLAAATSAALVASWAVSP